MSTTNISNGKSLTTELVFNKTKSDNLNNIKNLNLWGNQLEDLTLVQKMPNLEVISLSVNKISSLKFFSKCHKLHELYLRKNCIQDLKEIRYLIHLPYLKSLWLYDNPCAQQENYRQIVIHHLPNLTKLDNNIVSQQQKIAATNHKYELDLKSTENQSNNEKHSSVPQRNQPKHVEEKKKYVPQQKQRERQHKQEEHYQWKGNSNKQIPKSNNFQADEQNLVRNKNILIAILSLMKELDNGSLQIIRKQADKSIRR